MKKTCLLLIALLLGPSPLVLAAQPDRLRMTKEDYIMTYRDVAVADMIKTGVPASITLAQGILESEFGNSYLARKANNHFGIKCHKDWDGKKVYKDDDARRECFRRYASASESFEDHSNFLRTRERYASLFDLRITDYKGWARGLKRAGYATNPHYADRLIDIIEEFELFRLDEMGTAMPVASGDRAAAAPRRPAERRRHMSNARMETEYLLSENNVPYVIAKEGHTFHDLAIANQIELWQVLKYNDAEKNDAPIPGEPVYVKPKRARAAQKTHVVGEGETMRGIAQRHAVKLRKLYKYNGMACCREPLAGQVLKLRR